MRLDIFLCWGYTAYVSIHAPREGCDYKLQEFCLLFEVSIHAPREGCDMELLAEYKRLDYVSIHAPREGCDGFCSWRAVGYGCFNSRTPGGVRQCGAKLRIMGRINKRNLRLAVLL